MAERLTYKNRNGLYVLRKGGSPENVREAIAHLAAYEDSGLTPNEVQIFGKAHNAFLDAFCDFAESSANEHFEKQIKEELVRYQQETKKIPVETKIQKTVDRKQRREKLISKSKIHCNVFFDLKDWALPFRISLWIKRKSVKHIVAQIGPVEIIFVWRKHGE